jgi:AraC-like DNA-binding protein
MDFFTGYFPRLTQNTGPLIIPRFGGHQRIQTEKYRFTQDGQRPNGPDYYFIQYTLSGKGVLEIEGKKSLLERHKAFICVNTRPFLYYFDKREASYWEFVWFGMNGTAGQRIFEDIQDRYGSVFPLDPDALSVRLIFDFLARSRRRRGLSGQALSVSAYSFVLQLLEDLRDKGRKRQFEKLGQVQSYLHEHWAQPVDINQLAALAGFSREHFSRIFAGKFGVPPGRYLQNIRLVQARGMLKTTDLSLDKIAQACGLSDGNYLCRLFRRHFSMTPNRYRERL